MSFRPPKTLPILSIFHNANNPQSRAALQLLQQRSKRANGDDAYRIDVVDLQQPPTTDQLRQIASFLPKPSNGTSVWRQMVRPDAQPTDWSEVASALQKEPSLLERPIVVDWARGKAALGRPNLEAIEKLIGERLQSKDAF